MQEFVQDLDAMTTRALIVYIGNLCDAREDEELFATHRQLLAIDDEVERVARVLERRVKYAA